MSYNSNKQWIFKSKNFPFPVRVGLCDIDDWLVDCIEKGSFNISDKDYSINFNEENIISVLCDIVLELSEIGDKKLEDYLKVLPSKMTDYERFKNILGEKLRCKYNLENEEYTLTTPENFLLEFDNISKLEQVKLFNSIRNQKINNDEIIGLFDNIKNKNIIGKALPLIFETRNVRVMKTLYEKYNSYINKNDIKNILINVCKNINYQTKDMVEFLFNEYSNKIGYFNDNNIKEVFDTACGNKNTNSGFEIAKLLLGKYPSILDKIDLEKGKTPIDYALNNFNHILTRYLINKYLSESPDTSFLDLVDDNKKFGLLNCLSTRHYDDSNLFVEVYNKHMSYLKSAGAEQKYISWLNCELLKNIYRNERVELIENDVIDFRSITYKDFNNLLIELLKNKESADIKTINNLIEKFHQSPSYNPVIEKLYFNKSFLNINEIINNSNNNNHSNQVSIQRSVDFINGKIGKIYDTANHIKNGKKLYKVIYDELGNEEIIYYESDGKTILASARVDNNGLVFNYESGTYNKGEINRIINDNYENRNFFDSRLSHLAFASLENNFTIKTKCYNLKDIVNITKNNNSEKPILIDTCIDDHVVQIAVIGNNLTMLNTGNDFDYVVTKAKEMFKKEGLDVDIKQIKTAEQSANNCNITSKLLVTTLAEEYHKKFGNFSKLTERLNTFYNFMENVLKNKQKIDISKQNKDLLMTYEVLKETNNRLLTEKAKDFSCVNKDFTQFQKLVDGVGVKYL